MPAAMAEAHAGLDFYGVLEVNQDLRTVSAASTEKVKVQIQYCSGHVCRTRCVLACGLLTYMRTQAWKKFGRHLDSSSMSDAK